MLEGDHRMVGWISWKQCHPWPPVVKKSHPWPWQCMESGFPQGLVAKLSGWLEMFCLVYRYCWAGVWRCTAGARMCLCSEENITKWNPENRTGCTGQPSHVVGQVEQGGSARQLSTLRATWTDDKEWGKCNYWPFVPWLRLNRQGTKVLQSRLKLLNF